ncbi:zinc metalloproteinase nas-8-like [Patiria miniata]|uniref:Metalloendopeptidase n=1 Tax=Patiria miniata TaxID=46514 RepID=A0A913Z921_PATMI|nr:zinc metalloproteinase nas-8-like [Patiria miniata]
MNIRFCFHLADIIILTWSIIRQGFSLLGANMEPTLLFPKSKSESSLKLSSVLLCLLGAFVFIDVTHARPLCGGKPSKSDTEDATFSPGVEGGEARLESSSRGPEALVDQEEPLENRRSSPGTDGRRPWEINEGLCPPPLAHLCTITIPGPSGGTQQAFVTPFFEGDIILDPGTRRNLGLANMLQRADSTMQRRAMRNHRTRARSASVRTTRAVVRPTVQRWPDGIIPYIISDDFAPDTAKLIRNALRHWERQTCLEFREKKAKDQDYLHFAYYPGCWSYVGRQGGEQIISMGPGCAVFGTIVHEIGHAVGFWHEQSRRDRNKYINIMYKNIVPGTEENFGQIDPANVTSLGFPYDYESIMHYASNAFTANGQPTIKIKKIGRKLGFRLGQQGGLSPLDVAQVRAMYGCNQKKMAQETTEECTVSKHGDGRKYRGTRDYTVSGATCQKWNSQWPHKQEYWKEEPARNEKQGLGDHNYCRNPSGKMERPWCFTTLKKTRWEYCDVKICDRET